MSSKVGETLNAKTTPSDIEDVTFQWYADGKAIKGETKSSYKVTKDDIGKTIKVAATDKAGNTVESK